MKSEKPTPLYLRPQDVAKMYSISPEMVYKAIRNGDLEARKFAPRVLLIRPDDAKRWADHKFATMEQTV